MKLRLITFLAAIFWLCSCNSELAFTPTAVFEVRYPSLFSLQGRVTVIDSRYYDLQHDSRSEIRFDEYQERLVYTFDPEGQLLTLDAYRGTNGQEDQCPMWTETLSYTNHALTRIQASSTGDVFCQNEFEYEAGRLVKYTEHAERLDSMQLLLTCRYIYQDNGWITSTRDSSYPDSNRDKTHYEYHSRGRSLVEKDSDGLVVSVVSRCYVGQIASVEFPREDRSLLLISDEFGNITEIIGMRMSLDPMLEIIQFTESRTHLTINYEYDKYNNWVKKTICNMHDNSYTAVVREIRYPVAASAL